VLNVWRAYKSLNDEQRRIVRGKQIQLNRPIGETMDLFRGVAECDALTGKARTRAGCTAALAGVLLIPVFFLAGNAGFAVAVAIFTLVLIVFIVALAGYIWTRGIDISDNLGGFAMPVLAVFRDDIDASEPVALELDLRAADIKEKLDRTAKDNVGGAKIVDSYYVDPWMKCEAMLVDGSRVRWSVVDTLRVRKKTRTRGGKTKTKTKYAKKCEVDVEVTIRNKTYAVDAADAVDKGDKKTTLRESRVAKSEGNEPSDPRLLIEAVAEVYRGVTPVK
jgi:hypothetical protein